MITYRRGDIFAEEVDALVNPVNCVGVMGAGLALEFKKRWPAYFTEYAEDCDRGFMRIGTVLWTRAQWPSGKDVMLISFPTKNHWRQKSKLADVAAGLINLSLLLQAFPYVNSISMPALGCGLGGLAWPDVKLEIETLLVAPNKQIYVYEPQ